MTQQITAQLLKGGLTVDASGNVTATGRFSGPTQRTGIIKAQDGTTAITIADSTGKITIAGDLEVNGTTTTLDTTLENVDKLEVGANSTDYGAKINQAGTGDILQLQDGGTTVFVVEDGGNVGIGIDNPAYPLEVKKSVTGGAILSVTNEHTSDAPVMNIHSAQTGGSNYVLSLTSGSGALFKVRTDGNVGINAVAPRTKLEVVQSAFGAGQGIRLAKTLSEYWDIDIFADASNKLTFSNYNAGQVMTMDNSGKVGIGTTSPGNLLSVEADGGASWISTHHNTASSGNASGLLAKTTVESGTGYIFACNSNNSYKFVVKPDGNVGIGETVPLANLHVRSGDSGGNLNAGVDEFCVEGSGDTGMTILSGATSNGAIWFGKIGDNGRGRIDFDQNDGSMSFATTNIKRLIIDTSGNVGIGTDIPHSTLQLGSESQTVAGDGNLTLARSNGAGAAGKFRLGLDSTYSFSLGFFGYYGNDTYLPQLTVKQNGNVGIGVDAGTSKFSVAGSEVNPAVAGGSMAGGFNYRGDGTTVGSGAVIRFGSAGGGKESFGTIAAIHDSTTNGAMTFHVYNGGANHPEYMRIDSSGHVTPGADNSQDLGSSSKRWRNIYTTDLHLANERGNWTVIEEEDYLTLRNNKTDKVYKLVMEEIE